MSNRVALAVAPKETSRVGFKTCSPPVCYEKGDRASNDNWYNGLRESEQGLFPDGTGKSI